MKIKRFSFQGSSVSYESSSETINGKPVSGHISKESWNNKNGHVTGRKKVKRFSDNRETASPEILQRAKESGVIQKIGDSWRIVSIKKKKLWDAHYKNQESAEKALAAYHANK